uniref:cDNA FLJ26009 fis, clone HRT03250 n=1 Tax=Homo sapiens TaxID=9606 RepID=Q6ZPD4_HUMAN|nr:unnamed protein product [Homo sapiens]
MPSQPHLSACSVESPGAAARLTQRHLTGVAHGGGQTGTFHMGLLPSRQECAPVSALTLTTTMGRLFSVHWQIWGPCSPCIVYPKGDSEQSASKSKQAFPLLLRKGMEWPLSAWLESSSPAPCMPLWRRNSFWESRPSPCRIRGLCSMRPHGL